MDGKLVCTVPVEPDDILLRAWLTKVKEQKKGYITAAVLHAIKQYKKNAQCITIAAICTNSIKAAEYRSTLTFRYDHHPEVEEWFRVLKDENIPVGRAVKAVLLGSIKEVEKEEDEFVVTDFFIKESNASLMQSLERITKAIQVSPAEGRGPQQIPSAAKQKEEPVQKAGNKGGLNNPLLAFRAGK